MPLNPCPQSPISPERHWPMQLASLPHPIVPTPSPVPIQPSPCELHVLRTAVISLPCVLRHFCSGLSQRTRLTPVPSCNGGGAHASCPPCVPVCPQQTAGFTVGEAPVCSQGERWTQGHGVSPGPQSWHAWWASPVGFSRSADPMSFLWLPSCIAAP